MVVESSGLVTQQERPSVDGASELSVWHVAPLWFTIDQNQHRRGLRKDNVGRLIHDRNRPSFLLGLDNAKRCLKPVEWNRGRAIGRKGLDVLQILAGFIWSGWEIRFLD